MAFATDTRCIQEAEQALSVELPSAWRRRLIASNGGELVLVDDDWTVFPVFDDSDRKRAARSSSQIVRENESAREWRGFPRGSVAIAGNGSGDYLVLLAATESLPAQLGDTLYLWSHETGSLLAVSQSLEGL